CVRVVRVDYLAGGWGHPRYPPPVSRVAAPRGAPPPKPAAGPPALAARFFRSNLLMTTENPMSQSRRSYRPQIEALEERDTPSTPPTTHVLTIVPPPHSSAPIQQVLVPLS